MEGSPKAKLELGGPRKTIFVSGFALVLTWIVARMNGALTWNEAFGLLALTGPFYFMAGIGLNRQLKRRKRR